MIKTFEDQDVFFTNAMSGNFTHMLYAGDIRSGKTIICLLTLVMLCKIFQGSRWLVVRRDYGVLRRNVLPTFFNYCLPTGFLANFSMMEALFFNGSTILFLSESIERDPDLNRFKGLEINGALFDQCEEIQWATVNMVTTRCGQWKVDPMPPPLILMTCNPTDAWPKVKFYEPYIEGTLDAPWYMQEANILSNPYIDGSYIDMLRKTLPPELYRRYLEHQWENIDVPYQLYNWELIEKCRKPVATDSDSGKLTYLGVDVGHDGKDPSVWTVLRGDNIIYTEAQNKTSIPDVFTMTKSIAAKFDVKSENICVDVVGLGAGVGDLFDEIGWGIIKHKAGSTEFVNGLTTQITNFTFANLKALNCWKVKEEMEAGRIGCITERKLITDLAAVRYKIKGDRVIYIESKDEIRKRLQRSTDYFDSLCLAVWAKIHLTVRLLPGISTIHINRRFPGETN